jgi:hypothetical protein
LAFLVASEGVAAVVEVPLPVADVSTPATPLHSDTFIATDFVVPEAKLAVTLATGGAASRYHSSMRVFEPERKLVGPFVHVPPLESVTDAIGPVLPPATAIAATSASPAVVVERVAVTPAADDAVATFCCCSVTLPPPPPPVATVVALLFTVSWLPTRSTAKNFTTPPAVTETEPPFATVLLVVVGVVPSVV